MITTFTRPNYHPTKWKEIPKPTGNVVPADGMWGFIKLDYDRDGKSRPTRNGMTHDISVPVPRGIARRDGLPATCPRQDYEPDIIMTPQIQQWIHLLNWGRSRQSEADAKNSWRQLMADDKVITNKAGSTTHADYINRTNLDKEPMKMMRLLMAGAYLKIMEERILQGVACWGFEAIDALGDFRAHHPDLEPWLFFDLTNSVREELLNSNGVWNGSFREDISDPFPQYAGKAILPILSIGSSRGYVPKSRVTILTAGTQIPSAFRQ